jgi:hypothetical protein
LVENLLAQCHPTTEIPGLRVTSLTIESARGFDYLVTDERRPHPLIVVSPTQAGRYLVDVDRVRSLVAGLADVVRIPPDTDTFALADILGKEHVAWLGAVNVLFPPRIRSSERFVPRVRLMPEQIEDAEADGRSAELEILSICAHRMNLANARRHIRPEDVREVALRREMGRRRVEAERAGSTAELLPLYEEADRENQQKINVLEEWNRQLEAEVDSLEDEKRALATQAEGLKTALAEKRAASGGERGTIEDRAALLAVLDGRPSVEESLRVLAFLFPDRLAILDSAWKSAQDAEAFANREKALELMKLLATSYWEAMAQGRGDIEARKVFGNAYAARESETVEKNKRARTLRTFLYEGRVIEMWKHLKIGVKPSVAETLRVHFEWDDARKKIVIGHCGPHLDHS